MEVGVLLPILLKERISDSFNSRLIYSIRTRHVDKVFVNLFPFVGSFFPFSEFYLFFSYIKKTNKVTCLSTCGYDPLSSLPSPSFLTKPLLIQGCLGDLDRAAVDVPSAQPTSS